MAPTRTELDLSKVEKQLVILALQKQQNGQQQVERLRQQAAQYEQQVQAAFNADTKIVQEAHDVPETVGVTFDMRADQDTMFMFFAPLRPVAVADGPADPLA